MLLYIPIIQKQMSIEHCGQFYLPHTHTKVHSQTCISLSIANIDLLNNASKLILEILTKQEKMWLIIKAKTEESSKETKLIFYPKKEQNHDNIILDANSDKEATPNQPLSTHSY